MTYQAIKQLDAYFIHLTSSLMGRSVVFDQVTNYVMGNPLFTALLAALFWAYWFCPQEPAEQLKTREHLLATLWAGIAGIVIARTLSLELPFRLRPRFDPSIHLHPTGSLNRDMMAWSSFPSDHAVTYWAFAMGLSFVSRRLGIASMLYVIATVCLPRLYLGYHYFTDILAGIVIGSVCAIGFNLPAARRLLVAPVLAAEGSWPRSFYVVLFFVAFEFATMFDSLRISALMGYHFVEHLLAHT